MSEIATGEFVVKFLPLAFEDQPNGSMIGRMSIDKTISGDLVATTKGQMLSAMTLRSSVKTGFRSGTWGPPAVLGGVLNCAA